MNISFPDKQKLTFQAPKLTFYFNKIKKLVLKYNNIYLKKKNLDALKLGKRSSTA